jgi:cyclic-di-GMP phosphodiesterase TipF (flagellum assembly factor)
VDDHQKAYCPHGLSEGGSRIPRLTDSLSMKNRQKAKPSNRLQRALLEIVVPCAMALSAMAFSAGLYIQGGFGLISSLIAGVTLFLVMICAQAAYISSQRAAHAVERLGELEAAVTGNVDAEANAQVFSQLSDKVSQIDEMSDRVQMIDVMAERIEQLNHEISRVRPERNDMDLVRLQRLSAEVERIDARQHALRSQLQIEANERHEEVTAELQLLETLVKQMAENIANSQKAAIEIQTRQELPAPEHVEMADDQPQETQHETEQAVPSDLNLDEESEPEGSEHVHREVVEAAVEPEPTPPEPEAAEPSLINEVREAIESNRIELFLQPIMTLPQRNVRYYEALTRLRNESGNILMPKDYLHLAESAGIMSVVDNVMLYRSVQVLRRLEKRSSARGVFCNISAYSLLDPEFFPEFVLFMEQNQSLSESMYFEFSQSMIEHCSQVEQESLSALAALGFHFSLDHVTNLDLDFQAMQDRGFRFMKVDADVLIGELGEANAQIHAADMRSYLERFDIELVITKIESEAELSNVLDCDVKLGQGFLFSEPRPVRPEIFGNSDAEAAA